MIIKLKLDEDIFLTGEVKTSNEGKPLSIQAQFDILFELQRFMIKHDIVKIDVAWDGIEIMKKIKGE